MGNTDDGQYQRRRLPTMADTNAISNTSDVQYTNAMGNTNN